MWVAASLPSKATVGPMMPTKQATAVLDQGRWPDWSKVPLLKVKNTSFAVALVGDKTTNGTMIAKNPRICRIKTVPSTKGSLRARRVLKMPQNAAMAMTMRVPCQGCGS